MKLSDFDYELPQEYIAQRPLAERDQSKLMVLGPHDESISHHQFFELSDLLDENTVLVLNESRVIPARITFAMGESSAEILLIKPQAEGLWECMVRPGKKLGVGATMELESGLSFEVLEVLTNGLRLVRFDVNDFDAWLKANGQAPLPPYIKEQVADPERYQTVYSKSEGSVAAPTAGLHFTDRVFEGLQERGVQIEKVTLHVGLGTFAPVKTDDIHEHEMHSEWFSLDSQVAERLNQAKADGKRIVAVGTTSVRVLESCATDDGILEARSGETDIFIYPGYKWKFVDGLITNFHVPKSTLLMLVASLVGCDFILRAYEEAKEKSYRFFSFGDAMFIRP